MSTTRKTNPKLDINNTSGTSPELNFGILQKTTCDKAVGSDTLREKIHVVEPMTFQEELKMKYKMN